MEPKKRKLGLLITGAALAQLAAAVALMAYGLITHRLTTRQGNLLIAGALLLYWLLTDMLEPVMLKRFDGITPERKTAYFKFVVFDLAGYAGICYFLFSMGGSTGNSGIIGAAVYAFSVKLKHDNQDIFYGRTKQADPGENTQENMQENMEAAAPDAGAAQLTGTGAKRESMNAQRGAERENQEKGSDTAQEADGAAAQKENS